MSETKKTPEQDKENYLKNTTQKEMMWDQNQLLYWINENLKELNTQFNNGRTNNEE